MSELIEARLRAEGGAARRAALVRSRRDALRLADAVGTGAVRRVSRGVYALPGTRRDVVTAAVHNARLGCLSALDAAGVAVLVAPGVPHLSVGRQRGARPSVVRSRFPAVLHRECAEPGGSRSSVGVVSALARVLVCRPGAAALVSVDDALHRRLTSVDAIRDALPQTATAARAALTQADPASRSPLETLARLALRQAGLKVRAGVVIPMVGEVDLLVGGRVVVELDGYAFHSGRDEFREDRRRDRELVLQGYVVLRFTAADVLREPDRMVALVRTDLAAPRRACGT